MLRAGMKMINKNSATYIVIGILLIAIMTLVGTSVFVRVLEIEITGAYVYTAEEILEASQVSRGDNLIRLNAQTISQNIRASLPFVREVVIERRFPDTLFIEISESVPIAYALFAGDILVLDSSGRVLQRGNYATENLIEIRGLAINEAIRGLQIRPEAGAESRFRDMQEILVAFEREDIDDDVSFLDISNIQNINFGFMNIYRVILGNAGELRHKLHNLRGTVDALSVQYPDVAVDINVSDPSDVRFNRAHDTNDEILPNQAPEDEDEN